MFDLEEARRHGLTRDHLLGASWRRLQHGVYAWREIADEPYIRLKAAMRRLPPGAALSGRSAAWLHGLDVAPCQPIEATVPTSSRVTRVEGVAISRAAEIETVRAKGLPVTTRVQTLADLGRRLELVEAVVILDMALHRRMITSLQLERWADAHPGCRGVARLRRAIELAEPAAESPMETRLRLLLVLRGLPRPRAQVSLFSAGGVFLARPDLYYPSHRLGIEYDGAVHRDSLAADNRRQNRLVEAGYRLLRFTAGDIVATPDATADLVRRTLAQLPAYL